ncbi:MAG: hypothetical protein ABSF22_06530 [Bryobacteraceae bacterium]|jgi:hypothetical protein
MSVWYFDLPGVDGMFTANLNFGGLGIINRHSVVMVSVCELMLPGNQGEGVDDYPDLDLPYVGSAIMTIHNVAPQDNEILSVVVDTGWSTPVNIRLNVAVM